MVLFVLNILRRIVICLVRIDLRVGYKPSADDRKWVRNVWVRKIHGYETTGVRLNRVATKM